MSCRLHRVALVALLIMGSAILLFSCKSKQATSEESLDAIKTEESENLTIIMSENGRKSYLFKTPLLEGYTLGRDPYREFRKGISITTYQDDSLTSVNAVLVANYAIYYENRKLWEAKGDVVITKHDGTRLYTQQLFWNSITKRIYSNVDTKLVTDTDEVVGEGFESDEDMNEPRFRRWKGKMEVDTEQLRNESKGEENSKNDSSESAKSESPKSERKGVVKSENRPAAKSGATSAANVNKGPESHERPMPHRRSTLQPRPNGDMHKPSTSLSGESPQPVGKIPAAEQGVERGAEQGAKEMQKPMRPRRSRSSKSNTKISQ